MANQVAELVLAAIRRVSSRKQISLGTRFDDLDLSGGQRRSLYAAIRNVVYATNPKASLSGKSFAHVKTVGDIGGNSYFAIKL